MKKDKKPSPKQDAPPSVQEEETVQKPGRAFNYQTFLIPLLAVLTGLIIGALFIVFTDLKVLPLYQSFFLDPLAALKASGNSIATAYGALFAGALGSLPALIASIQAYSATGDSSAIYKAIYLFNTCFGFESKKSFGL